LLFGVPFALTRGPVEAPVIQSKGVQYMNWDQIAGQWKQMKGSLKEKWGQLTEDDLNQINGQRDKLIGKLQERYGIAREEAMRRADEWFKTHEMEHETHPVGSSNPSSRR
jgi:uncharacterized protein YjbJ (UPF0337 family)